MKVLQQERLGNLAVIESRAAQAGQFKSSDTYLGLENLTSGGELVGVGDVVATTLRSNKYIFDQDCVLFGKLRPYLAKVARPAMSGICSTDILVIRPGISLNKDYLYWWLRSPTVIRDATEMSTGATLPRISPKALLDFEIPLPSIAEQQRIAGALDRILAATDRIESSSARQKHLARSLRATLVTAVMDKEDHFANLGEICEIVDRLRRPLTKRDRKPGPIPYYGASGIIDYVEGHIFDEELVLLGEDGAKWGAGDASAFAVTGKAWVNNHAHVLRPNHQVVRTQWLVEYLNAADLTPYITGLTVPKLNQGKMRTIPVPLPNLAVQDAALARIESLADQLSSLEVSAAKQVEGAGLLAGSVLGAAFRGEL